MPNTGGCKHRLRLVYCKDCLVSKLRECRAEVGVRKGQLCDFHRHKRKLENQRMWYYINRKLPAELAETNTGRFDCSKENKANVGKTL